MKLGAGVLALLVLAGACASTSSGETTIPAAGAPTTAPTVAAEEPRSPALEPAADARLVVRQVANRIYDPLNSVDPAPIARLGESDDERWAWIIADALRFVGRGPAHEALLSAGESLAGIELEPTTAWLRLNNHLLIEDVAAPPGYRELKAEVFEAVDVTWTHLFTDPRADLDWRLVSFGGVRADRRSFGSDESCQCIPSLDNPPAVDAAQADWYPADEPVFGLVINGESRAYPRNIMAVHEMVNDVVGGRQIALPYCTLCGSAQAYFLDDLPTSFNRPVLRTSGLLQRSNKISMDLQTLSMVDTFTGRALSGPWLEAGVELTPINLVTTTWGAWLQAHPGSTLMAGKDGDGASYPLELIEPLPDTGLAFPVGRIDDALFPDTPVLGVLDDEGASVAFERAAALATLADGGAVELDHVIVTLDAGGLRARDRSGTELVAHEAAWFAWSQFYPDTRLWQG